MAKIVVKQLKVSEAKPNNEIEGSSKLDGTLRMINSGLLTNNEVVEVDATVRNITRSGSLSELQQIADNIDGDEVELGDISENISKGGSTILDEINPTIEEFSYSFEANFDEQGMAELPMEVFQVFSLALNSDLTRLKTVIKDKATNDILEEHQEGSHEGFYFTQSVGATVIYMYPGVVSGVSLGFLAVTTSVGSEPTDLETTNTAGKSCIVELTFYRKEQV